MAIDYSLLTDFREKLTSTHQEPKGIFVHFDNT